MTKQILAIDDDDGVRDIIRFGLISVAGWDVVTAACGQDGIAAAVTHQPDAILLDVMMPGMDGTETFQQLQVSELTCHIPIILLTAKASNRDHKRLTELGVKGLIVKPFRAKTLVAQIRSLLNWD